MSTTLADAASTLIELREQIRDKNEELKALEEIKRELEDGLREMMIAQGVSSYSIGSHSIRVTSSEVPNVVDWDEYYRYIRENDALHLLERRPATVAWRDEKEFLGGGDVPGTTPFVKIGLSITTKR